MTRDGRRLRVGLVSDELTHACLRDEADLVVLTPANFGWKLRLWRPDLIFVESAWKGWRESWKYRVAAYPDHPRRDNGDLVRLVARGRDMGIPTVFWNKEDGVHFDRFIDSAKHFDHVFTVDELAVPRYRAVMGSDASVHTLTFAVQPRMHGFTGFDFRHRRANFAGSYSTHIHDRRRDWQHLLFDTAASTLGLTVFDRNSARKGAQYRYPDMPGLETRAAVGHAETARIYKEFLVSLNVNTIEDSPTMFSRRLVEILGCGGIALTTPALSVEHLFADYCHVVHDEAQVRELLLRLKSGPSPQDLERARAGADTVRQHHTWSHRLRQIIDVTGLDA